MFFNRHASVRSRRRRAGKRRAIEQALGTSLPPSASDLHYSRRKLYPNSDLNLSTVYIKFRTSRQAYLDLMQQLGAQFHKNPSQSISRGTPDWHYTWPDEWRALHDLDWWDINFETTEDVAVAPPGKTRMRAKYERGSAYIKSGMV